MSPFFLHRRIPAQAGRICQLVMAAGLIAACTETPTESKAERDMTSALERSKTVAVVNCVANRQKLTVQCGEPAESGGDARTPSIILGRQGVYVDIGTSNVNYDAGTGNFTFNATVRNRITQALGTTNGVALDPSGVRVFFHSGPTVTSGSGLIEVFADGVAAFTAPNQPFYQYNEVLSQFELSPVKQWRLNMPSTVTSFVFSVMVNASVQFPDGYIDVQPAVFSVAPGAQRVASAFVRNANGEPIPDAEVTWSSSDPNVLVIDAATGLVTGVKTGTTSIVATSGTKVGSATFSVGGVRRIWNGNVSTDWENVNNWDIVGLTPTAQTPSSQDTAVIPADRPNYPLFDQNVVVGGVEMQDGGVDPTINIGAFDFTLNSSIDHGPTGLILGTGRMLFNGSAKTISGGISNVDYRHARFFGTYSLNTNLNITGGRLVAQGGRLRSAGFRIRVRPN